MRYPQRDKDFGSKERKVGYSGNGAVMPPKRRTGYADGGSVMNTQGIFGGQPMQPIPWNDASGRTNYIMPTDAWNMGLYQFGADQFGASQTAELQPGQVPGLPPRAAPESTLPPYHEANLDSLRAKGREDMEYYSGAARDRFVQGTTPKASPPAYESPALPVTPPTKGFALGGSVGGGAPLELDPKGTVSSFAGVPVTQAKGLTPQAGGPEQLKPVERSKTPAVGKQRRTGYAKGGAVHTDTFVTGDTLAKEVQGRFDEALQADDKQRRAYAKGGSVDIGDVGDEGLKKRIKFSEDAAKYTRAHGITRPEEAPRMTSTTSTSPGGVTTTTESSTLIPGYDEGGYVEEDSGGGGSSEAELERQRAAEAEAAAEAERKAQAEAAREAESKARTETAARPTAEAEERTPGTASPDYDPNAPVTTGEGGITMQDGKPVNVATAGANAKYSPESGWDVGQAAGQPADQALASPFDSLAGQPPVDPTRVPTGYQQEEGGGSSWLKDVANFVHKQFGMEAQAEPSAQGGRLLDQSEVPTPQATQAPTQAATNEPLPATPFDALSGPPPVQPQEPAARTGYYSEEAGGGPTQYPGNRTLPAVPGPDTRPPLSVGAGFGEMAGEIGRRMRGTPDPYAEQAFGDRSALGAGVEKIRGGIESMLRGDRALLPDQVQQLIMSDPKGDHNAAVQKASDELRNKGDMKGAAELYQGLRPLYDNTRAFAQAALNSNHPEAAMRAIERMHNNLPDNANMKINQDNQGNFNVSLVPIGATQPSQIFTLSPSQMNTFVMSNASQYDHVALNDIGGTLKRITSPATGYQTSGPAVAEAQQRSVSGSPEPVGPSSPTEARLPGPAATAPDGTRPLAPSGEPGQPHPAWKGLNVQPQWDPKGKYMQHGPSNLDVVAIDGGPQPRYPGGKSPAVGPYVPVAPGEPGAEQGALKIPPGGRPPPGWTEVGARNKDSVAPGDSGFIALPPGQAGAAAPQANMIPTKYGPMSGTPTPSPVNINNSVPRPEPPAATVSGGQRTDQGYPVRGGVVYPPGGVPYTAPRYDDASRDPRQGGVPYSPAEVAAQRDRAVTPPQGRPTEAVGAPTRPLDQRIQDAMQPRAPGVAGVARDPSTLTREQAAATLPPLSGQGGFGYAIPGHPDHMRLPDGRIVGTAQAAREREIESGKEYRQRQDEYFLQKYPGVRGQLMLEQARGQNRLGTEQARGQGRLESEQERSRGRIGAEQVRAGSRETIESDKFDRRMAEIGRQEEGKDKRAGMRDATNRWRQELIESRHGQEIAAKMFDARQREALTTYRAKLANGIQPTEQEQGIYRQFNDEVHKQGFRVPPQFADEYAPARGRTAPAPGGGAPVRVQSMEEAMKLPAGTVFVSPDGITRTR